MNLTGYAGAFIASKKHKILKRGKIKSFNTEITEVRKVRITKNSCFCFSSPVAGVVP